MVPLVSSFRSLSGMRRDAGIILGLRVLGAALWLVYTIVLARTLSSADFSAVLYIINFSLTAVLVVTLGRDVTLLRFASKAWAMGDGQRVRHMLSACRRSVLLNGAVLSGILVVLTRFDLGLPITNTLFHAGLAGALTTLGALMGLNRDCLRSIGLVWQSQLGLNVIRSVVPLIGSGVALLIGRELDLEVALLLFAASLGIALAVEEHFLRRAIRSDAARGRADMAEFTRASRALWPGDVANAVMMRAVGLVGTLGLTPELAASLLAAERIAGLAQFPIGASAQAVAPQIARATNASDKTHLQAELNRSSQLMFFAALLGAVGTAGMAWPALWALGPQFLGALPSVLVLCAACLAWGVLGLAQTTLNLIGQSGRYSIISVSMALVTVALVWWAAQVYGPMGAAVAWAIGWWLTLLLYTIVLWRVTGLRTGLFAVMAQFGRQA